MLKEPLAESLSPWAETIEFFYVAVEAGEHSDITVTVHLFLRLYIAPAETELLQMAALEGAAAAVGPLLQSAADQPGVGHFTAHFLSVVHDV